MRPVLILGGYGNFGKRIARALVTTGIPVVIAGRQQEKADTLRTALASPLVSTACFDAFTGLDSALETISPCVVVNTCGPFQTSDYSIAETCVRRAVHYLDLADGRSFVTGITDLDASARAAGVCVISGASTVPALSSSVLEHFAPEFSRIDQMTFGISPGQRAERGLATTEGILSYAGRRLAPFAGSPQGVYGWQDLYRQPYPELGKRWMANCDIPDLDLLPARYDIKSIRFSAGLEFGLLHLGLWGLSLGVRFGRMLGIEFNLARFARPLLSASNWFDRFGSPHGGMHIILKGRDTQGNPHTRRWFIIAKDGFGPHIPTIPAIILARQLAHDQPSAPLMGVPLMGVPQVGVPQVGVPPAGAQPCVGLIALEDYLSELTPYPVYTVTD